MVAERLLLFTDGSVRGNPGPAGIGVVVADENGMPLKRFGEQLPPCTNNELIAEGETYELQEVEED